MPPTGQLTIVVLVVMAAIAYLIRQAVRAWRGSSGCSKGCGGCGSKQLVPLDRLSTTAPKMDRHDG